MKHSQCDTVQLCRMNPSSKIKQARLPINVQTATRFKSRMLVGLLSGFTQRARGNLATIFIISTATSQSTVKCHTQCFLIIMFVSRFGQRREGGGGGGGRGAMGDSHLKGTGMLVVSLRVVNYGFWSRLGCSAHNVIIFSCPGLVASEEITKKKEFLLSYLLDSYKQSFP